MSIKQRLRNPFYAIAVVLGLLFTLTASAEFVLMLKSNQAGALPRPGESGYELMYLLDQHGTEIFVAELAALGVCTVAAIRLDHVRGQRVKRGHASEVMEQQTGDREARSGIRENSDVRRQSP